MRVLAQGAGLAPAEARMRLMPEPPAVVVRSEEAEALAKALTAVGAPALAIDPTLRHGPVVAHRFELGPAQVTFVTPDGRETEVSYGDVRLILRGLRLTRSEQSRTETVRKFSLGKALLTQGLMMTTTQKREVRSEVINPFHAAMIYGADGMSVLLDESELVFQSLGAALRPSRVENLNTLVGELRKRASAARFDDRLLRLGPRPLALAVGDPFDVVAEILNQAQLRGLL